MKRRILARKIIYLVLIGLLLLPLSQYTQPAITATGTEPASPGGHLARLRTRYGLSQANLGEIDPAGETIKLATLGLRGIAANILWSKVNKYKTNENWTGLSATLDQLSKLQPHYISVWRYQGWNLSYNVSVEWDDYRDRYFWVKEGIKFLDRGARYNKHEPRLIHDIGWFTAQKVGRADERVEFRKLFVEDDDEVFPDHRGRGRPRGRRDNWLVGQEYLRDSQEIVDANPASLGSINPLTFHSQAPMCQINYAVALEEEGTFGERARIGWEEAARQWKAYGDRPFVTVVSSDALSFRLNDLEMHWNMARRFTEQLDALAPGLREKIKAEKHARLSAAELEAMETPPEALTEEAYHRAAIALQKTFVSHQDVADRIQGADSEKAQDLAKKATNSDALAAAVDHDRQVVNYEYWQMRCEVEGTADALETRQLIYEADQHYREAALTEARLAYEKAFTLWRNVIDKFPRMRDDTIGGDSVMVAVEGYLKVLNQLDEPFNPEEFILFDLYKRSPAAYPPGMRRPPTGMPPSDMSQPSSPGA